VALPLLDQYRLAEKQEDFRDRIMAACVKTAIQAIDAAPNGDPVIQANRIRLAGSIIRQSSFAVTQFAYAVVASNDADPDNVQTDVYINQKINTARFDTIASQMFPATP